MIPRYAAVSLCILALCGCGRKDGASSDAATSANVAQDTTRKPLAGALDGAAGFATISRAIKDTGLTGVFDGKAHYTLLAPTDAAFAALGDKGAALQKPEQRAALAALVRAHVVPGDLSADDIKAAVDRAGGKPVKLHALDKSTLTVAREGDRISVTAPDGAKAMITDQTVKAANGGVIGIDGVLKKAR